MAPRFFSWWDELSKRREYWYEDPPRSTLESGSITNSNPSFRIWNFGYLHSCILNRVHSTRSCIPKAIGISRFIQGWFLNSFGTPIASVTKVSRLTMLWIYSEFNLWFKLRGNSRRFHPLLYGWGIKTEKARPEFFRIDSTLSSSFWNLFRNSKWTR